MCAFFHESEIKRRRRQQRRRRQRSQWRQMVEAKAKKANECRIIETIAINVRNKQHLSHNRHDVSVDCVSLCVWMWVCVRVHQVLCDQMLCTLCALKKFHYFPVGRHKHSPSMIQLFFFVVSVCFSFAFLRFALSPCCRPCDNIQCATINFNVFVLYASVWVCNVQIIMQTIARDHLRVSFPSLIWAAFLPICSRLLLLLPLLMLLLRLPLFVFFIRSLFGQFMTN